MKIPHQYERERLERELFWIKAGAIYRVLGAMAAMTLLVLLASVLLSGEDSGLPYFAIGLGIGTIDKLIEKFLDRKGGK